MMTIGPAFDGFRPMAMSVTAGLFDLGIMTITCANKENYEEAARDPEKYDLLRARMGGWTEFFVTMFPAHQAQHERRPVETPASVEGGSHE